MAKNSVAPTVEKPRSVESLPMSIEQRVKWLTAQLKILKRHQWPGIEDEVRAKRAELRALLLSE